MKISPLSANERIMVEDITEKCSIYIKDKFPGQLEISFSGVNFFKFFYDNVEKNYKLLVSKYDLEQKKPGSVSEKEWNFAKKLSKKRYKILKEKIK
jgi:hypothetical protein